MKKAFVAKLDCESPNELGPDDEIMLERTIEAALKKINIDAQVVVRVEDEEDEEW